MTDKTTFDKKHLTTSQRIKIEKGLNDGLSMAAIARSIHKHPTTVSNEVLIYGFTCITLTTLNFAMTLLFLSSSKLAIFLL